MTSKIFGVLKLVVLSMKKRVPPRNPPKITGFSQKSKPRIAMTQARRLRAQDLNL
jgi:hypothetical protein